MMSMNDLIFKVNKARRTKERKIAAQKFAVEIGVAAVVFTAVGIIFMTKTGRNFLERLMNRAENTSESLEDDVVTTVSTVKHAGEKVFTDVRDGFEDLHKKAEQVIDDMKDGNQDVANDIQNTVDTISDDLKPE